jgi:hypothetical protein
MRRVSLPRSRWYGTSAEAKPLAAANGAEGAYAGDVLYETDSGRRYEFDGTAWRLASGEGASEAQAHEAGLDEADFRHEVTTLLRKQVRLLKQLNKALREEDD